MTISTRIQPIGRDISLLVSRTIAPEAMKVKVANFARSVLAKAEQGNASALGHVPAHDTFVDGAREAPLESVKLNNGHIVFAFKMVLEVLQFIDALVEQHSPVRSGRYQKSRRLFVDGNETDIGSLSGGFNETSEFVFAPTVIYGPQIERGWSQQAPDGVYQVVAAIARDRFGRIARIDYGKRSVTEVDVAEPAIIVKAR